MSAPIRTGVHKESHGEVLTAVSGDHLVASFSPPLTACGLDLAGWGYREVTDANDIGCEDCRDTWRRAA